MDVGVIVGVGAARAVTVARTAVVTVASKSGAGVKVEVGRAPLLAAGTGASISGVGAGVEVGSSHATAARTSGISRQTGRRRNPTIAPPHQHSCTKGLYTESRKLAATAIKRLATSADIQRANVSDKVYHQNRLAVPRKLPPRHLRRWRTCYAPAGQPYSSSRPRHMPTSRRLAA